MSLGSHAPPTILILGGGASLASMNGRRLMQRMRALSVMVVHDAYKLVPNADILLFSDDGWFVENRFVVSHWTGLLVTSSVWASALCRKEGREVLLVLKSGPSGGHDAIKAAMAFGMRRIVLAGYDDTPPLFDGWNADCLAAGVEVLNTTQGTALQFPSIGLDTVLEGYLPQ